MTLTPEPLNNTDAYWWTANYLRSGNVIGTPDRRLSRLVTVACEVGDGEAGTGPLSTARGVK